MGHESAHLVTSDTSVPHADAPVTAIAWSEVLPSGRPLRFAASQMAGDVLDVSLSACSVQVQHVQW
jgi:hypothetical protein